VNLRALLAAAVVIILMPIIYLLINGFSQEEELSFRGLDVREIAPEDGSLKIPNETENAAGVPLLATFTPAYIEKITGWKSMNPKGLALSLTSTANRDSACQQDGSIPLTASFKTAQKCAQAEFIKMNLPSQTAVFVSPEDTMIVFGNKGDNRVRLQHNTVIAAYSSPDMTQGNRKTEACIAKMMISHLLNAAKVDASVCKVKQAQ
jgi:hypothetical protein